MDVISSPKNSTASILLKIGIRFPNKEVRPAPNLAMAAFQKRKESTEFPMPRYKITDIKEGLQLIGPVLAASITNAGNNIKVPNEKVANKKLRGDMPAGFLRTRIL